MEILDKIVIGIPNNGTITMETAFSLMGIIMSDSRGGGLIDAVVQSQSLFVDLNRNNIVDGFLNDYNSEWLLFVDTDIEITLEDVYRLHQIATNNDLKILGGVYFYSYSHKSIDSKPAVQMLDKNGVPHDFYNIDFQKEFFRVDSMGTGSLLIHRDVLNDITRINGRGEPYWFKTYDEKGSFMGEDVYFCRIAKECGYNTYATPQVTPNHVKSLYLTRNNFEKGIL